MARATSCLECCLNTTKVQRFTFSLPLSVMRLLFINLVVYLRQSHRTRRAAIVAIAVFGAILAGAFPVSASCDALFGTSLGMALFVCLGAVIGPFTGGNEAEWTRYLETLVRTERDRLLAILNTMEEGVTIVGPDYKIRFMNPSMVREFGDGVGSYCYKHLHGFDEPCDEMCRLPEVIRGSTERSEYDFPDGRIYDVMSSPFADSDQVPCMLSTFRNITRQKQVELELVKLNQLKSELLSNVSHELRSPLTSIKGIISSLLQEDIGWDNESRKMLLIGMSEETDRLASLVTNLLNMSKLDAGVWGPERERCSVPEIATEALERQKWISKNHTFETDFAPDLPEVFADSNQIKQVLINLLENAAAYSEEGTSVVVKAKRMNNEVEVTVSDQGVGIPPQELEKIFDKFYRGTQKRRRPGGTGLGLAICRAIVLAHGGRVWAESEVGRGSTFHFTLLVVQPRI
jgi:nitrogen-specific signal transduction histidine kinase